MREWLRRFRLPLLWGVILLISAVLQTFTVLYDASVVGRQITTAQAIVQEASSHAMWLMLLPAIYWLQRRLPVWASVTNILAHIAATVPVSLAHVLGMVALRHVAYAVMDASYTYGFTLEHLLYEYRKDAFTYLLFSGAYVALNYIFARIDDRLRPAEPEVVAVPTAPLTRLVVRKRDKEVLVAAEEIGWIEAAGNYAILHVGGEKHEIRSSLARLEGELDPASFVRVHKSAIVNIGRVREVEPWFNGDYRIRLQDGTEVPLSRRYRARFEEIVPARR
jgi:DNA-binding LytR/AlgR family response regulator